MSEALERSIAAARAHVHVPWDEARAAHLTQRAIARRRRQRLTFALGASVAIAAAIALWLSPAAPPIEVAAPVVTPPAGPPRIEGALRFADGSVATPLEDGTEVLVDAASPAAIELELARGAARFEVTPGLPRAFAVRAAHLTATVVGTVFVVRRRELAPGTVRVEVEVLEGTVRVDGDAEAALLRAGEARTFETTLAIPPPAPSEPTARAPRAPRPTGPETSTAEAPSPPAAPTWRSLADEGRFDEGYALLLLDRDVLTGGDLETLLVAADCARLSGHPAEALAYLQRAAELGENDPRAALIAFTTGRVLLGPLHRPADAAARFSAARALAPEGSLASDALAREVEAWAASGDTERARARAEEYLSRYPSGVHADAVRHHGGLD